MMEALALGPDTLTSEQLDALKPSKWQVCGGWARALIVTGLLLPISGVYYALACFVLGLWNFLRRRTYNSKRYGQDAPVSIELVLSVLVVSAIGVVATVGTGLGFYLLTVKDVKAGWQVLGGAQTTGNEIALTL